MAKIQDSKFPATAGPPADRRSGKIQPRPLIGIPTVELPGFHPDEPGMWAMRQSYLEPIIEAGGMPLLLPPVADLRILGNTLGHLDGLLLAGGHDINPGLYGGTPSPSLETTDPTRDTCELGLTQWALAHHLPILGICRGMQMINIAAGGTLQQDVPDHRVTPARYSLLTQNGHPMRIEPQCRLRAIIRRRETWMNSLHHHAIDQVGADLIVVAQAADGIIEGIEAANPDHWLIGIQGHPEALVHHAPWTKRLFAAFATAAAAYQQSRIGALGDLPIRQTGGTYALPN